MDDCQRVCFDLGCLWDTSGWIWDDERPDWTLKVVGQQVGSLRRGQHQATRYNPTSPDVIGAETAN